MANGIFSTELPKIGLASKISTQLLALDAALKACQAHIYAVEPHVQQNAAKENALQCLLIISYALASPGTIYGNI